VARYGRGVCPRHSKPRHTVRTLLATALAALCALAASLALVAPSFALYRHEYLPNLLVTKSMVEPSMGFEAAQIAMDNDPSSSANGKLYVANHYYEVKFSGVFRFEVESEKYRYDCAITGPTTGTKQEETECGSVSAMSTASIMPSAVAVDQATGDVYVGSPGQHVVDEFAPSGNFIAEFNGEHTPAGSFEPGQLAVSRSGKVYVLDSAHDVIDVFTSASSAAYDCQISGHGSTSVTTVSLSECDPTTEGTPTGELGTAALALDESGASPNLYVVNRSAHVVDRFTTAGAYLTQLTGPEAAGGFSGTGEFVNPLGVAVEQSTGEVYVYDKGTNYIDQFSSPGAYQGRTAPVEGSGERLTVDQSSGDIYLSGSFNESSGGSGGEVEAWGPGIAVPAIKTGAATEVAQTDATLNGVVDPEATEVTSCLFQYGTTTSYGHSTPCDSSPGAGNTPVAVHAHVNGLLPGTSYHFRIVASYAAADSYTYGEDETLATLAPRIESESTFAVSEKAATVEAQIDPEGINVTECRFEYRTLSEAAFAYTAPCSPSPGNVDAPMTVSATIALTAGMSYRYRVEVTNEFGAVYGEEQTLVAEAEAALVGPLQLLDGRQWELVSPPDKHGGDLLAPNEEGLFQAASDGRAMTFISDGATEESAQYSTTFVQVLSVRGASAWSSRDIATPHNAHNESTNRTTVIPEYQFFSPDLSLAMVQPQGPFTPLERCSASDCEPEAFPEATEQAVYLRRNFTSCESEKKTCYEPLVTAAKECGDMQAGEAFGGHVQFLAASPDGKHIVIETGTKLGIVEWSAEKPCGEQLSETIAGPPGVQILHANRRNAVSEDGSRIFWNRPVNAPGYVELTDLAKKETLQIGDGEAIYETASADGSVVFYREPSKLYACRIVEKAGKLACETTDLAPGGGKVATIVFASEDGSYVYFLATGDLSGEEASPRGETAVAGAPNLYMRHYDVASEEWEPPRLIAVASPSDNKDLGEGGYTELASSAVRVSPDGRWLAFMASKSLTGYDNRDVSSGESDAEVYLYHAPAGGSETGKLVCVSCNPTGARPTGEDVATASELLANIPGGWFSGAVPGWNHIRSKIADIEIADHQPRYLSNGGGVFFDSAEALVPQDVNGALDVYEYEPPKSGEAAASDNCTSTSSTYSEQDSGCVDLISSGESAQESAFLDASENGDDAFFLTRSKLVGKDHDTAYDVYDAHVCTSEAPCFPEEAATPPPCTATESCREAPTQQPSVFGPPPSATFSGAGDLTPSTSKPAVEPKALTRAQKLKRALSACRKKKDKRKRAACERQVRKSYGAKASGAKNASGSKSSGRRRR
jgi:hypothetical protein